jgi:hypothetical protein
VDRALVDLSSAFEATPPDLPLAAQITVALQYYSKLLSEVEEWEGRHPKADPESGSK